MFWYTAQTKEGFSIACTLISANKMFVWLYRIEFIIKVKEVHNVITITLTNFAQHRELMNFENQLFLKCLIT